MPKSNHNQAPPVNICSNCRMGACCVCVDVLRLSTYTDWTICGCGKGDHAAEVRQSVEKKLELTKLEF